MRFRSFKNIVKEIQSLQRMGLDTIHFDDDMFGVSKNRIKALCEALAENCSGVKWSCELHVKLIDDEIISLMKRSGCYLIQLGIESGNNDILKLMRKGFTIEEALQACKIIKRHGILLYTFFIVGFPHETEETLQDTVSSMKKVMSHEHSYSIFTPYPGTEAFQFCKENGLIGDDFDVSLFNHQSPNNCFCLHISPERFRSLVTNIERMVDRRIFFNNFKKTFSFKTLIKLKSLGFKKSLRTARRLLVSSYR